MMIKLLFFCALLAAFADLHAKKLLNIEIYYETLHPASNKFITEQLFPTFKAFGKIWIKLDLIPYGFASQNYTMGRTQFECDHGPDECYGNKIHSCVIYSSKIDTAMKFINCGSRSSSPASSAILKNCAEKFEISWIDVNECVSTGLADKLLSRNGRRTGNINLKFMPTITFDGKFHKEDYNAAIKNLKKVVCEKLNYAPDKCRK